VAEGSFYATGYNPELLTAYMVGSSSELRLPLRDRVLMSHAVGLVFVATAGLAGVAFLQLSLLYVQKAVGVYAVIAVVTLLTVDDHHPFPSYGLANLVTTARAAIVALVTALIGEITAGPVGIAAAAAALASACLDGVDGWLARRSGLASAFGARFDMETDALLILGLSVLAWRFEQAGWWIVFAGLLRYLFVAVGWIAPRMQAALLPSARRQAICVVQIIGLSVVVSPLVRPPGSTAIAAALLALLVYSFAVDTVWLWRRA
jgi:phosphatidylglycerophosphate synthase